MVVGQEVVVVLVSFVSSPWVSIRFDDAGAGSMRGGYRREWMCGGWWMTRDRRRTRTTGAGEETGVGVWSRGTCERRG